MIYRRGNITKIGYIGQDISEIGEKDQKIYRGNITEIGDKGK